MQNIDLVPYLEHQIQADKLTETQIQCLAKLNQRLTAIEQDLRKEAIVFNALYQPKVRGTDAWPQDYEADMEISFCLMKSDPAYDETKDNILVVLTETLKNFHPDNQIGDGLNHNEFLYFTDHPMKDECHCWLYHCLYQNTEMGWADLLRVGGIWVNLRCTLKHFVSL